MSLSLQQIPFELWRRKSERKGIRPQFKPVFTSYIGVENQGKYNDVLATIHSKIQDDPRHTIFFDGEILLDADFNFINAIKNELANMDVTHLSKQDITLFENSDLNHVFLNAFEYVVNLAIRQENFLNDSVRNNFICKLLLYAHLYIQNLDYSELDFHANHCFYYGDISRHDIYFLILLYIMGFDVVYINPLRECEYWKEIDSDKLCKKHKNSQILPIQSFLQRASQGHIIEENRSITLELEEQIEKELFSNSGIYRPWQFRNGTTSPIFFNGTLIDLEQNWKVPAKLRQGFKTQGKTVYVPTFFFEIEGEYKNSDEYAYLIKTCIEHPNSLFLSSTANFNLISPGVEESDKFQLTFCQLSNGKFDIEEIMKLPFYRYSSYNDETEKFILSKINETIDDHRFFKKPICSKEEILDFAMMILMLDKKIIRTIDSFDFTNDIPKLVIFLEEEEQISKRQAYLIAYLNKIGFDIVIFSPAGLSNLNTYIQSDCFNSIRLDKINYERRLSDLKYKQRKQNFFSKFFS